MLGGYDIRMRIALALFICLAFPAVAQTVKTEEHAFRVVKLADFLEHPWSLAFLPDGRLLVTERPGRLRIVKNGVLEKKPVEGLPQVTEHGQGGLHDVVLHPRFAANQFIYLAYAARGRDGVGTELARARLVNDHLENLQV